MPPENPHVPPAPAGADTAAPRGKPAREKKHFLKKKKKITRFLLNREEQHSLTLALWKHVKELFGFYQITLVGIRWVIDTIWDGGESGHPSLGGKFLLLRADVHKLTGNDVPHPFLTCSLFL